MTTSGGTTVSSGTDKRRGWWKNRGRPVPEYERAIDKLHQEGYQTELWVDNKKVVLRWMQPNSRWHVIARGSITADVLQQLSRHALMWLAAVQRKQGNEANYAVREV